MDGLFLLGILTGLVFLGGYCFRRKQQTHQLSKVAGTGVGLSSFFRNPQLLKTIALQKQVNQELYDELIDFKHLLQISPIGFLQVDDDNQLLFCNDRACELLGIERFQPKQPRLLLEWVRSYELDALIEQTRHSQVSCQSEWLFHPVDADYKKLSRQQPRPLRGYGFPMANDAVGVFLENREEAVMLAQQRDRWISDVAHELKTPLTSIRLVAETLQSRLEPPTRTWVERLLLETIRLSSLVQDLLDLNQLQVHPTARLSVTPLDLPRLIQSAWVSLEPLAFEKNIQMDYNGPERLVIQADEAKLHRVLLNLLDNSLKFSPINHTIWVKLALLPANHNSSEQQVHLEVIDAGPGFSDEALPFVFERFYRADPSRTRNLNTSLSAETETGNAAQKSVYSNRTKPQASQGTAQPNNGSGLGLAIVRQIVEAHNGTVTADNHPQTGGAWLQVFLPWRSSGGE